MDAMYAKNSFHLTVASPLTKYIQNSVQVLDYSLVPSSRPHPAQEKCDGAADPVG